MSAVNELARSLRSQFVQEMAGGCLENGKDASVDGIHLKANGKHYYDFTVRYMRLKNTRERNESRFQVPNK